MVLNLRPMCSLHFRRNKTDRKKPKPETKTNPCFCFSRAADGNDDGNDDDNDDGNDHDDHNSNNDDNDKYILLQHR